MRIVIDMDQTRSGGRNRLLIRTRYSTDNRDGRMHLQARNAMVKFYNDLVNTVREGVDPAVTDFIDEGERA